MTLTTVLPVDSVSIERFRLLVDSVVDYGIFMLDPGGHVVSWNTGATRIKGYVADEVMGRHFSMFYTDEARATGWPQQELKLAKQKGRFEDEGWRVRKDGSRFWANVVITSLTDPDGSHAGFAKVTRDLTERRRHEQALRESEERLRLMVEGVQDYAIYMLDPEGIIQSWNTGAQILKGYSAAEAIGRHFSLFYRPEELALGMPENELRIALEKGRAEEEGWRVRKDGSRFWANVVITAIRDAEGQLRGFAKITRDMSERRRLEELERSSRRMNEFLAMLAHELRNPLAPIRNAVTVLQLEPSPSPVVKNSREMIDRQLTHMTRLVDDLLDVGRLSTGKIRLKKETLLYNQVLSRSAEAMRPIMDARHHTFAAELPQDEVYVDADGIRLTQVIQNLLTNAAKYTPAGGRITLRCWVEGAQVWTEVSDNGLGLTQSAIEQIFELFSQGDMQSAAKESGLGIGLTLAKSLVEMHGGVLSAESEGPDKGSRFRFSIPGKIVDKAMAADAPVKKFLVVDDNRDAADSLAEILRLLGHSAKVAYNGVDALEIARTYEASAALVDIGMPGMNGFEVAGHLRGLPHGSGMLIAAVTGYGNEEEKSRTQSAGFDCHLVKPVDFQSLEDLIQRLG
ncbi:hybrid sensor histidine kinase/response regulator [Polaromonas sp. LjRoot131]|uniref:PAS domain-containing hybrid sensor histidine kinase/response regulator n=1 Tax=Polaromonas sp. LjRoot131 TaxID=3342262 RepID=UPI003ECCB0CA